MPRLIVCSAASTQRRTSILHPVCVGAVVLLGGCSSPPAALSPHPIPRRSELPLTGRTLRAMERVVEAQLSQPTFQQRWFKRWQIHMPVLRRFAKKPVDLYDWNHGVLYQGLVAFSRRTGEQAPADLVSAIGRENGWEIGTAPWRPFDHPDDFAVGAAYLALQPLRPEPGMLDPLRRRARRIMAADRPSQPWWIDALAMAPPTWADLACRNREPALLTIAASRSLDTALHLHNPSQQLFFRDDRHREPPVFWGRGNGWAVAGLARVLGRLPADHTKRASLLRLYRNTFEALMARRTEQGQLPSDLLRPAFGADASATALLVFAGAHGINSGLLDRSRWQQPILFSWEHLLTRVTARGELIDVQPPGDAPGPTVARSTHPFAAGAFLLAGEEVLTLLSPPSPDRAC